jgi:hypothetical protein
MIRYKFFMLGSFSLIQAICNLKRRGKIYSPIRGYIDKTVLCNLRMNTIRQSAAEMLASGNDSSLLGPHISYEEYEGL